MLALFSTLIGIFGGLIPDIFKEVRESREHARELERMDKQAELQIKLVQAQTDARLEEIRGQVAVEEMRALAKQMENIYKASQPIGIKWVDAWNAMNRPLAITLTTLIFSIGAACLTWGVVSEMISGRIGAFEAAGIILGGVLGEYIQAVWGFLFGYRSTRAVASIVRGK